MKLLKKLHIHFHTNPIISNYLSFNSRDVVFECRCGHRKLVQESRNFGEPFSLNWTCNLNSKEIKQVLERNESKELLIQLSITKKASLSTRYF